MSETFASGQWVNLGHDWWCPAWSVFDSVQILVHLGPVSLTVFPWQFKFDGNFFSLSPRLHYRDRYKILYMARQLCCRGLCKNLLRSDGQHRSYGKTKFPSYLNCGQKNVSETGPRLEIWADPNFIVEFVYFAWLLNAQSIGFAGIMIKWHCCQNYPLTDMAILLLVNLLWCW